MIVSWLVASLGDKCEPESDRSPRPRFLPRPLGAAAPRRSLSTRWVEECIPESLDHAGKNGVTLILENHYKDGYWNYPEFAQKKDVFLELVGRFHDHPCLGVNYDPSNAINAGDDPIER